MQIDLERERRRLQEEEERARIEAEKKNEEEERARIEAEKKQEYEELLQYTIEFVESNPMVVSGIFKVWLTNDGLKQDEMNAAAAASAGGAT
jgi:flagellar M-ring protein FliF